MKTTTFRYIQLMNFDRFHCSGYSVMTNVKGACQFIDSTGSTYLNHYNVNFMFTDFYDA